MYTEINDPYMYRLFAIWKLYERGKSQDFFFCYRLWHWTMMSWLQLTLCRERPPLWVTFVLY